jgi:hypothetical protein
MRYLNADNINKDRHLNEDLKKVQVNTYYYKRYKSENQILYFIMFICFIIISIALIKKKITSFDDLSYSIIVGIIITLSLFYISYSIYLLIYKDEVNYDEDNYPYTSKRMYDISGSDISGNVNYDCLKTDFSYNFMNNVTSLMLQV